MPSPCCLFLRLDDDIDELTADVDLLDDIHAGDRLPDLRLCLCHLKNVVLCGVGGDIQLRLDPAVDLSDDLDGIVDAL